MFPISLKRNVHLLLIGIIVFSASFIFFGFHYERYEPFLTGLFSGQFTPGIVYNHFYFFGHIGLLKVYSGLYLIFPNIPWLNIILYGLLMLSFVLVLKVFVKYVHRSVLLGLVLILLSVFYMEQHVFYVYTRISFLLSFASLFYLLTGSRNNDLNRKNYVIAYIIFLLALITRSEPAMISLLLVVMFDLIVMSRKTLGDEIVRHVKLYFFPGLVCLLFIGAFILDIQHADQFFKQVEPELEYELMSRNNIVDVSTMTTRVDSLRYMAVYNGMWGDASTNSAAFLRSLVGSEQASFSNLFANGLSALSQAMENSKGVLYLNSLSFLLLFLVLLIHKDYRLNVRVTVFHLLFWALIFLKSYKVKMIETALSPMLLMVSILYLFLFLRRTKIYRKRILWLSLIVLSLAIFLEVSFIGERSENFEQVHLEALEKRAYLESNFAGKKIFLNQESSSIFADSYRPFEKFKIDKFNRVYYFDRQHLTTLEPYRSFLALECECDPNNYSEFFQYVLAEGNQAIFLMSEPYKEFLTAYLSGVHHVNMNWLEVEDTDRELYWTDKQHNRIRIYTLTNP